MSGPGRGRARALALLAVCLYWGCRKPQLEVQRIPPEALCVSSGALQRSPSELWVNTSPSLRATIPNSLGHHAALSFRYLGRTTTERALGSGQQRAQLGLRLLARNTCNGVYVMWRLGTSSSMVASVKSNPGASVHAECKNHGYRNLKPLWSAPVEEPSLHSVHELSARIDSDLLEVRLDGRPVLRARLTGLDAPAFGSSGLRSDNVQFELLELEADVRLAGAESERCVRGE